MDSEAAGASAKNPARRWFLLAIAGAVVAVATFGALVLTLSTATRQRDAALGWQQHSYEVMILARSLDAAIGQSEAALGRFVLSGDKNIGRIYFDDWRRAGSLIDRLDSEVEEPATQRVIDALRSAYIVRGNELAAVALRTNYGQNPEALSKYYQAGKAHSLRRIDTLLESVIAHERTVLTRRSAEADATISRSNRVGAILSVLGLALVVALGVLGWASVQSWSRRLTQEVRNERLEFAVAARTSELSDVNARLLTEMTTRQATEERLRQAQKMEAIGQLTGGIAHDFNNMLAVVVGGIELAQRRIKSGGDGAGRHLEQALEGANRAAALTKRLLAFSRAEPLLPVAVDPDALLTGMSDLLDRSIGDTITVRLDTADRIWRVFVDPHQLESAIVNLAVNARDAMPEGGTLSIAATNVTLTSGEADGTDPGEYVRIDVTDTGTGMARAVLDRAFEPFFTTKPAGQGTGLGLSQIFGFARQSGGTVMAASTPGTGTTVSLFLPRSLALPQSAVPATPDPQTLQRRPGTTVLVVEDDPRVLASTADALEELGLTTIRCAAAADAAALVDRNPRVGLIVSDVSMPGMTGPQLVAAIHRDHPGLPVLFVTGFAGDIDSAAEFGGHPVLRKPFTIAALGKAVATVLASDPVRRAHAA